MSISRLCIKIHLIKFSECKVRLCYKYIMHYTYTTELPTLSNKKWLQVQTLHNSGYVRISERYAFVCLKMIVLHCVILYSESIWCGSIDGGNGNESRNRFTEDLLKAAAYWQSQDSCLSLWGPVALLSMLVNTFPVTPVGSSYLTHTVRTNACEKSIYLHLLWSVPLCRILRYRSLFTSPRIPSVPSLIRAL